MNLEKICQPYVDLMGKTLEETAFEDKKVYANFLAQTFFYVSHSTRFLAFAAGLMKLEDRKYFQRFIKHISEESGHELMALKDLNKLGFEISEFKESSETRMLWETQYYKIQHLDPMSLMGYIIPLEMMSAQYFPKVLERVNSAHTNTCTSFVRVHAEEDQSHIVKAFDVVEDLAIDRQKVVIDNVFQTAVAYSNWLESLSREELSPIKTWTLQDSQKVKGVEVSL